MSAVHETNKIVSRTGSEEYLNTNILTRDLRRVQVVSRSALLLRVPDCDLYTSRLLDMRLLPKSTNLCSKCQYITHRYDCCKERKKGGVRACRGLKYWTMDAARDKAERGSMMSARMAWSVSVLSSVASRMGPSHVLSHESEGCSCAAKANIVCHERWRLCRRTLRGSSRPCWTRRSVGMHVG